MTAPDRKRLSDLPLAQQAGILCNDAVFRDFAAARLRLTDTIGKLTPMAAAEFLRGECRISSRRALDTDQDAADRFARLKTDFMEWAGRMPSRSR